jgi:hypothetical protein
VPGKGQRPGCHPVPRCASSNVCVYETAMHCGQGWHALVAAILFLGVRQSHHNPRTSKGLRVRTITNVMVSAHLACCSCTAQRRVYPMGPMNQASGGAGGRLQPPGRRPLCFPARQQSTRHFGFVEQGLQPRTPDAAQATA